MKTLNSDVSTAVSDAIHRLVADLVAGNYEAIEADGRIGRCTPSDLRRTISEYGRTLVRLPSDGLEIASVYPSSVDKSLTVDLPLWTREEGRSDLTLVLEIVEDDAGVKISIDDLLVQ